MSPPGRALVPGLRSASVAAPLLACLATAALLAACGAEPPGVSALYDPSPTRPEFFAQPWPSDDRLILGGDGHRRLDLKGFYDPGYAIHNYLEAIAGEPLDGFGTQSAIYFRFDGPLDPASLPASSAASVRRGAGAFLVDTTPSSPTYGRRHPARVRFSPEDSSYIGPNWLALMPEPGLPLRERTTYTAVITDAVRAADGGTVHADPRFESARARLDATALGLDPARVVVATTFTTLDATSLMRRLREAVHATGHPVAADMTYHGREPRYGRYDEYVGTYVAPNFQEGQPPYNTDGGRIHLGAGGNPEPVRMETMRFAMSIPRGATMPDRGWPIVLYAHGTGGDYKSFLRDGSAGDAAHIVDAKGAVVGHMAMISIDQVLHGPRDPSESVPDLTFFNLQNLVAARDNARQGALDNYQLVRLVERFDVTAPVTRARIRFDPDRIYFKGHSQGGLTGPLFLAYEPSVKAAILSGAGANFILALLNKTEPTDIRVVLGVLLEGTPDEWHPMLTLVQTALDVSDPANYGRLYFREPPDGVPPKSIFQSLGLVDHYTPVETIKAFALAMGVQPARPELSPIPAAALDGLDWADPPLSDNYGGATGVLCQYLVPLNSANRPRYDGHFVIFRDDRAVRQSSHFLWSHATTGTATLVP